MVNIRRNTEISRDVRKMPETGGNAVSKNEKEIL